MSLLNMLKMVNNAAVESSPTPRTPSLHDDRSPPDFRASSPDIRASSPEIDVDTPADGGAESPQPQLSPADIKEEEEEEEEKPDIFTSTPSIFSPLALHLQRPRLPPHTFPIFQPFLPAAIAPMLSRNVPFSIDAILRPDFGRGGGVSPPTSLSPPHTRLDSPPPPSLRRTQPLQPPHRPVSPPSTSRSPPSSSSPNSSLPASAKSDKITTDSDCPPGMVRGPNGQLWPAWVFCTRYSDRPSSGPRLRKVKKGEDGSTPNRRSGGGAQESSATLRDDKRPRTAFSSEQLGRLKHEFDTNRYLTEERRRKLSQELGLNENQIKIWFQNKRAKLKKATGHKGELAQMLSAQGLYNHSTTTVDEEESALLGI